MIFPSFSEQPNAGITVKNFKRTKIYLFVDRVLGLEGMGTEGSQTNTCSSCFNDFNKWPSLEIHSCIEYRLQTEKGTLKWGFTSDSSNFVPDIGICHHCFTSSSPSFFFFFFFFCFFRLVDFSLGRRAADGKRLPSSKRTLFFLIFG